MATARAPAQQRQGAQLAQPVDRDAAVELIYGLLVLPDGCDRDLVAARLQLGCQHLRLALGPADERRVVVACDQDPHPASASARAPHTER